MLGSIFGASITAAILGKFCQLTWDHLDVVHLHTGTICPVTPWQTMAAGPHMGLELVLVNGISRSARPSFREMISYKNPRPLLLLN